MADRRNPWRFSSCLVQFGLLLRAEASCSRPLSSCVLIFIAFTFGLDFPAVTPQAVKLVRAGRGADALATRWPLRRAPQSACELPANVPECLGRTLQRG